MNSTPPPNTTTTACGSASTRPRRKRRRPDFLSDYVEGRELDTAVASVAAADKRAAKRARRGKAPAAKVWYATEQAESKVIGNIQYTEVVYKDKRKEEARQPASGLRSVESFNDAAFYAYYFGEVYGAAPTPVFQPPPSLLYIQSHMIYGQLVTTRPTPRTRFKSSGKFHGFALELFQGLFPQAELVDSFGSHSRYSVTFASFLEFTKALAAGGGWTEVDVNCLELSSREDDAPRLDVAYNEQGGTYHRGPVVLSWFGTSHSIRPMQKRYTHAPAAVQCTLKVAWYCYPIAHHKLNDAVAYYEG